jgi:hypothetical protein
MRSVIKLWVGDNMDTKLNIFKDQSWTPEGSYVLYLQDVEHILTQEELDRLVLLLIRHSKYPLQEK